MRGQLNGMTLAVLAVLTSAGTSIGQECKPAEVFAVIDRTGQRLREINGDWQPRLRAKLGELAKRNGWNESEIETKGRSVLDDEETRALDGRAAELLADLHRLGDDDSQSQPVCSRLDEARTKSAQLIEVSQQRSAHAQARIDIALKPPAPASQPAAQAPGSDVASRQMTASPRPKATPPPAAWDTRTVRDAIPTPAAAEALPPPPDPGALGYSPEEIRAAGRGFFGSISAGLASVIDHAFQRYGRPTGYVLGDEGGGAFLAGLRYGEGRLVTKSQGERKVYWQGPSAGFDFGLAGSQVMFLVYNVEDHQQMFQRFTGVDGSAYLVGGVGITFLKRGKLILAPIRTGIGMRLGANLGYLKFTPSPSLNPF